MIDDFDWTFGLGDFDGDGEVSDFEEYAYLDDMEMAERAERQAASAYYYDEDDGWQDFCEDGSDYDLDPYDFDSQEEYEEALELAKEENGESYVPGALYTPVKRAKSKTQKQTKQPVSAQEKITEPEKELTPEEKRKNHKTGVLFMGGFWIAVLTTILSVFVFIKQSAKQGSIEGCGGWLLVAIFFGVLAKIADDDAKDSFSNKITQEDKEFLPFLYILAIGGMALSILRLIVI